MNYDELKQIAQPHIRKSENLPSNSFLLLNQLHIPFKNEKQCAEDYGGKMNPLDNYPAFLAIDNSGIKTIYFNSKTKYWNFYIFHEISHYLLGHEDDCPQNEIDADMLACMLVAPLENFPSTIKSARDLSVTCQIPIDKAEMYWQEIKHKRPKRYANPAFIGILALICFALIIVSLSFYKDWSAIQNNVSNANGIELPTNLDIIYESNILGDIPFETTTYYKTSSGTRYHKADCQYIKYKTNVTSITFEEIKSFNLVPCKRCISKK